MMDRDTIANYVQNLSKARFDAVCKLVLTRVFSHTIVDTDGKGDGGFDYTSYRAAGGRSGRAVQRTIQDAQWAKKARDDAATAAKNGAQHFMFLTSRIHESSGLRALENSIAADSHLPAMCLGGRELADLIVERDLIEEFVDTIGLDTDIPKGSRPDPAEQMLHGYIALSNDRANLRDTVYEDSVLLALEDLGGAGHPNVITARAAELLGLQDIRSDQLRSRLDSLLTRGLVQLEGPQSDLIALSASVRRQLRVSRGIYVDEMRALADVIQRECGLNISSDDAAVTAILLARMFIQEELSRAAKASLALSRTGLLSTLGDPEVELRELLHRVGVAPRILQSTIFSLVGRARIAPVIKKLASAALFLALEGQDTLRACKCLGANRWAEVRAALDASVAIPFVCARLFGPTAGRFSRGVTEGVSLLTQLGVSLTIPWVYLNEAAAHLLRAFDYDNTEANFADDLQFSENAYVAHYFQLKALGNDVPPSLRDFLVEIAPAAGQIGTLDSNRVRKSVMDQLQALLRDYSVDFEQIDRRAITRFRVDVERSFIHRLEDLKRTKKEHLLDHDVQFLAHQRYVVSTQSSALMCLTWDAALIAVARELGDCGWVISPVDAADLVQPRLSIASSSVGMCALAHRLASAHERPSEAAARIVDRVVSLAKEQMQDWGFRSRLREFKAEALDRLDLASDRYRDLIDEETDRFLRAQGVDVPAAPSADIDPG